jgi:F0F1-type ATP synthase membrane subunit b/b'
VGDILEQLELNQTFLIQFAIFAVLFVILANLFFKPFMRLFAIRHKRTIEDREAAEKMMAEANARFDEYRKKLHEERLLAKKEFEAITTAARKEEAVILSHAREEAKKITQEANDSIAKQRENLKKQIEADIESLANGISERLLSRKV